MSKIIIFFLATFLISGFYPELNSVMAQSPSVTDTNKEVVIDGKEVNEASAASTEAIKELILKKVAEQSDQASSATDLENLNSWQRAIFGVVEKITDNSISVSTKLGNLVVPITENLSIRKGTAKTTIKNIAIDNWALVTGTTKISQKNQQDFLTSLNPQSLVIFEQDPQPKTPFVELGTVKSITRNSLFILSRNSKTEMEVGLLTTTSLQDTNGQSVNQAQFEIDTAVLVVGYQDGGIFKATTLRSLAESKSVEE
ncbi:MAG TPA: hypothetical protein PKX78_03315 [Candidatus Woesebacteria bacterium]|nr:hypothetical protein [Candidatus Woesebacteria bacterium]